MPSFAELLFWTHRARRTESAAVLGLLLAAGIACTAVADDWPQWRGPRRDGVWREKGIVERFKSDQIPIKWKAEIGCGYSGPTVADGRVYVTDRVAEPKQIERVHCFDWKTGRRLWLHEYDCEYRDVGYSDGPRAAVTIDEGRAYSLGSMGHFICFDAAEGKVLWQKDVNAEYKTRMPIWGLTAAPLIDEGLVVVQAGGEQACLVAFDKATGQERWKALDDRASYSAPIVIEQAGRRVMIAWTGDNVAGLDPQTGDVLWQHPFPPKEMVINVATPVVAGDRLFVSSFYDGSLLLRLADDKRLVEEIWRRRGMNEQQTDALHCMIGTPYLDGDHIYGVDSYGQLRCLSAENGDRVWESLEAVPKARWSTIHMVRHESRTILFNERGELIIAELSPAGYREISRAKLLAPTTGQLPQRGGVCWAHPAFAYRHVFARSDSELVCASLAAEE